METYFAPAGRDPRETVAATHAEIEALSFIKEVFNAFPFIAGILNDKRQIIYSNQVMLESFNFHSLEEILGNRPGEIFQCIHSAEMPGGCGTSESCRHCAAVKTILQSQETRKPVTDHCMLRVKTDQREECLDVEMTATPFFLEHKQYTVLTITDISARKRKEVLEKIFFHDILNTAGTLQGLIDLLKQLTNPLKIKQFINMLDEITRELTEEIFAQKYLLTAENGELTIQLSSVDSLRILKSLKDDFRNNEIALGKTIVVDKTSASIHLITDTGLLRRVLINMLKNALEATGEDEKVTMHCEEKEGHAVFSVHNSLYIPREIQLQLFQRSFSTKGKGRGLGTYSMKLLGERYLRGHVYFETDILSGTTFYFKIPFRLTDIPER
jgi:signal transduction histidine kinase